jgi:hypothetical protein
MRLTRLLGLIGVTAGVVACGGRTDAAQGPVSGSKEASPQAVLARMAGLSETLVASVGKADGAAAVAAAFNTYSDGMEKLIPEVKAVLQKHPELKGKIGVKGVDVPAEYKPYLDRLVAAGDKMWDAMKKAEPYLKDEAVQKAQQRFTEVMAKME